MDDTSTQALYEKLTYKIIIKGKLKTFPLKPETRQQCSVLSLLFIIIMEDKRQKTPKSKRKSKRTSVCR